MYFQGVHSAIQTPFAADGSVDHETLARAAQRQVNGGVSGIVACGTMGEAQSLSPDERRAVIATVVEAVGEEVPVTAGISSETPALSARLAEDASAAGATAVMALPPLGYNGDEDEIIAWFQALAAGTSLPIMAYNNPKASGNDMSAALIARIAYEVERVVAIKECSGDVRRIPAIIDATADDFEVLVGGDDWPLEGFAAGATGWISGAAVVAPEPCAQLFDLCRENDFDAARRLYSRILPLARLDMTHKLVQYFKEAQDLIGVAGGGSVRPPRQPLRDGERSRLRAALDLLELPVAS
jgi:4-hydroxy-tetrahydrodipicolinate synthase